MKKLIASMLMFVFIMSFSVLNANALTPDIDINSSNSDKSTFTVERLINMTWDELVSIAPNASTNTEDDQLVVHAVNMLLDPQSNNQTLYYHFGMAVSDISDQTKQKAICVALLFDAANSQDQLDVIPWETEAGNLFFTSLNTKLLTNYVQVIGQYGMVAPDSLYWESSKNYGSLNHGTISQDNPYLLSSHLVKVDGVSYLDEEGEIESFSFEEGLEIDTSKSPMVHIISAKGFDLGWISYDKVMRLM